MTTGTTTNINLNPSFIVFIIAVILFVILFFVATARLETVAFFMLISSIYLK